MKIVSAQFPNISVTGSTREPAEAVVAYRGLLQPTLFTDM